METTFLQDSFQTAEENMRFDRYLLDRCMASTKTRFVRFYEWKSPGITIPEQRQLPPFLAHLDCGPRTSGGGIVFHGKGDFVFSIVSTLDDVLFSKRFKDKIDWISTFFGQCLIENNIHVGRDSHDSRDKDINYCVSYSNPYEYFYNGHKVLGLAQRRYKHVFCSQGIIYCRSNFEQFPHIKDELFPYLTEGLQSKVSAKTLIETALNLGSRCMGIC